MLSFVGYPEWKVAIDGRLYMFSKDEWLRYNDTARGTIRLSNIEERENPDAFFLRESFHPSLIKELAENPGYLDVANEDGCRAFVRHR